MNIYIEETDSGVTCGPYDSLTEAVADALKSNAAEKDQHWVVRGHPVEEYLNATKGQ